MIEKLTNVWKQLKTKQLAKIFEEYMQSIGVEKRKGKRKDNSNTYMIDGKATNWNRVQCYYHKESERYGHENLLLVLRKRAGNYFIIQQKGIRAFEVDYKGLASYDRYYLDEIIKEHKPLFDKLFEAAERRSKK